MTFINGILLAGAAAFLVPLLIHIFNRSKFRVIKWGATHLLESVIRVNRKRIQIEQIILLIIRCAIPILLAVCLARMVIQEWNNFLNWILFPLIAVVLLILAALFKNLRTVFGGACALLLLYILASSLGWFTFFKDGITVQSPTGDVPASTVVLLDNSYSMQASNASQTSFEQAITVIDDVLDDQNRGSDVSVILMGGKPTPIFDRPTFDREGMSAQLSGLNPTQGAASTLDGLNAAIENLGAMSHAKREILLVSDFQRINWDSLPKTSIKQTTELLANQRLPVNLTFLHVGQEMTENVSIDTVELSPRTIGAGQQVRLRVHLRNHGDKAYGTGLRISLYKDNADTPDSETDIPIGPQEATQALLTCTFEEAGSHHIRLEINSSGSDLKFDNEYRVAVNVLDRIGVLLVDGDPSEEWLKGETDFIQIALTPFTKAKTQLKDLIEPTITRVESLDEEALKGVKVVVLANVPKLEAKQLTLLEQFVKQGGGLLATGGDNVDIKWHNQYLSNKTRGLLPMRINNVTGSLAEREEQTRMVAQHFDHEALHIFNDRRNGNLAEAEIAMWNRLVPANPDIPPSTPGAPTILALLESGDPLLAEREYGDGMVLQLAIPLDASWTNLPARAAFLPLVQQLTTYLASRTIQPHNIPTGQPITAHFDASLAGASFKIRDPEGIEGMVKATAKGNIAIVEFPDTRKEGLYTVRNDELESPVYFVTNSSRTESQLDQLNKEEVQKHADQLGANVIYEESIDKTLESYASMENQRRHGREMWKILMLCVLGFMVGELMLQQFFGRAKS